MRSSCTCSLHKQAWTPRNRARSAVVHPAVARAVVLYVVDAPAESLRHVDIRPLAAVDLSHHSGNWSLVFHSR